MEASRGHRPPAPTGGHWRATHLLAVLALLAALVPAVVTHDNRAAAQVPAGSLDVTFDGDGIAITDIGSDLDVADAARQPLAGSERVLVLESTQRAVWRFHPDGRLDTAFADDGVLRLTTVVPFIPTRIAAGPDGRFVVGGWFDGEGTGVKVARFLAGGQLDTGFGDGGIATILSGTEPGVDGCAGVDLERTYTNFSDLGVQSGGTVVVVGPGDIVVPFGSDCGFVTDGVVATRLNMAGEPQQVRAAGPCTDADFVEPRTLTVAANDAVFVSVAFQCSFSIDPVTVFALDAGLAAPGQLFTPSPFQPTEDRRLPIAVHPTNGSVAVAVEGPDNDPVTWRLLRWNGTTGALGSDTSVEFPGEVSAAPIGDIAVANGRFVVVGGAGSGPLTDQPLALATAGFSGTGVPDAAPTLIDHPSPPPTSTAALVLVRMGDGFRAVGNGILDVFGVQPYVQIMLARLTGAGVFDGGFGPDGTGFAMHDGNWLAFGLSGAVLPDGRILAGGPLFSLGSTVGFVLRHLVGGPLDPVFRRTDIPDPSHVVPGVEITAYGPPPPDNLGPADVNRAALPLVPPDTPPPPVGTAVVAAPLETITVDNDEDAGPGSFREAIELASDATQPVEVVLPSGLTVDLTSGQATYVGDHDLTIIGNGSTISRGDDENGFRVLDVTSDASPGVRIEGLTITNPFETAVDGDGGAIRTTGDLVVVDTVVDGSEAFGDGGAFWVEGNIEITNSRLTRNVSASLGGAVWSPEGDILVTDSQFEGNVTGSSSMGAPVRGGAIGTSGNIWIIDSTFSSNRAEGASDGAGEIGGGAVWSDGHVEAVNSEFSENRVLDVDFLFHGFGGAIRGGSVRVTSSAFRANTLADHGGAIWADGQVVARDSQFIGNRAFGMGSSTGGAISANSDVLVTRSTFGGNRSDAGGAIWTAGSVHVTDSTLSSNIAQSSVADSVDEGGAVRSMADVFVSGSTFTQNLSRADGGGIRADGEVAVTNSTFTRNVAGFGGEAGHGAAIWSEGDMFLTFATIADNSGSDQVFVSEGVLHSLGTVVATPTDGDNCDILETSSAYSHSTDATCDFAGPGDTLDGPDPQLGARTDNGGPTETMLPGPTSPLRHVILGSVCEGIGVTVDQRGLPRPQGQSCDIGAVEQFASETLQVQALAVDSQERIVIVGLAGSGGSAVMRLLANGGPDPTFNGGIPKLVPNHVLNDVAVDDQDRIVAVGEGFFQGGDWLRILRLDIDGTDDGTFGTAGAIDLPLPIDSASARAVTLDDDGRIVVAGWYQSVLDPSLELLGPLQLLVARILPDGTRDGGFGPGSDMGPGVVLVDATDVVDTPPEATNLVGSDVVVRDGRIVVSAWMGAPRTPGIFAPDVTSMTGVLVQLTDGGVPDPDFSTQAGVTGLVVAFPGVTATNVANAVTVDAAGRILVAGGDITETGGAILLARVLPNGQHDLLFGTDGVVRTEVDGRSFAHDVTMAPDGKIVVVGAARDEIRGRVVVARYLPGEGSLVCDPPAIDFGPAGVGVARQAVTTCTALGGPVTVSGMSVTGTNAADFTPAAPCIGATLPGDATCEVTVTFSPAGVGARTATLAVDVTNADVPTTVGLRGQGVDGAVFLAEPDPVDFDEVPVGETSGTRTVTITNVGSSPFFIEDFTLAGTHGGDFSIVSTTCLSLITLSTNGSCTVTLTFTPTSSAPPVRLGQLVVTSNAPGSPHRVTLRGPVTPPTLTLDPEEGPIETEVEATGERFDPGIAVSILMNDEVLVTIPGSEVSDGTFTAEFVIPPGVPGGPQPVTACQRCGQPTEIAGIAPFTVTPRLFVVPELSRPGGVVRATGDGYPANVPVTLSWNPGLGTARVTADDNGEIRGTLVIFRRDFLGPRLLEARISGDQEVVAEADFRAVPGSVQPGFQFRR